MSACQYEMKFPIRPAPPPPVNQKPPKKSAEPRKPSAPVQKKKPPPRPPPPKLPYKKSAPSRPGQLIADLFHRKSHLTKTADAPAPKAVDSSDSAVVMLIDFTSPPSSPTLTTRSSSDALSVNSFGSDGVTPCSGSSGNGSNVESGFEDDFDLLGSRSQPRDPWSPPPKPPEPKTGGGKGWVAFPSPGSSKKAPPVGMPTIIRSKPEGQKSGQQKPGPGGSSVELLSEIFGRAELGRSKTAAGSPAAFEEEDDDGWSSESPPMPTCPPPAPPPEVLTDLLEKVENSVPHGIALYDYPGEQPEDLTFRKGDVVYLVRKIDENWYRGRTADDREGSVPANFIALRVPLPGDDAGGGYVTALYAFRPETWDDLAFEEGSVIKVTHRIDHDWLYGECEGRSGQFPASFVDHVPGNLPLRRTG